MSYSARISAVISVHNEEHQLADCLSTLAFADEIVVLLDKCTDGSGAIARRFSARIVYGDWFSNILDQDTNMNDGEPFQERTM